MGITNWWQKFKKTTDITPPSVPTHKLKLGLALSGGGTRGVAYIGVFRAFEEAGIKFDYVAGTSAGSLLGAAYCAGLSSKEIEEITTNIKAKDILTNKISFMPSKTEKMEIFIKQALKNKTFEDFSIPFTAVAVDIIKGEELHITTGDIGKAIAGSCAFPGAFNPVDFGEKRLLDGGLMNNIPADVVREMGADIVLAVDLNPTRGYGTDSTKYLEVMKAALRILMKSNSVNGYLYSDYVLKLDLSDFKQTKLEGVKEMIDLAYNITKQEIPNILKVLGMPNSDETIRQTTRRIKAMQKHTKIIERENKKLQETKNWR